MAFKPQFIKSKCGNTTFFSKYPIPKILIKIAVYTFNASSDVIPTFNTDFKNYKIEDLVNSNGTITRTISSYELPTTINFSSKSALLSVEYLDTSNVTDMSFMFNSCKSLTSLDLSKFNTSKVTDMTHMFYECSSLTSLNLSNWDTSKVTEMSRMFLNVPATVDWHYDGTNYANWTLTEEQTGYSGTFPWNIVTVAKFTYDETIEVPQIFIDEEISYYYYTEESYEMEGSIRCLPCEIYIDEELSGRLEALPAIGETINFSLSGGMEVSAYTDDNIYCKFYVSNTDTENGHYIQIKGDKFDDFTISDVDNQNGTITRTITTETDKHPYIYNFYEYEGLISVEYLDTSNVTNMNAMFQYCSNLVSVDGTGWDVRNVIDMENMFYWCTSLVEVKGVSNWKTDSLLYTTGMFEGCSSLTTLDISGWNVDNMTHFRKMFEGCSSLTTLNFFDWSRSGVFSTESLFEGCSSLTRLDVSDWNMSGIIYADSMFKGCSSLTTLDVSNWDTRSLKSIYSIFDGCSLVNLLDVSGWNTEKVKSLSAVFKDCSVASIVGIEEWNTANMTSFWYTFAGCKQLENLDLSGWNTANVTDMRGMFEDCTSLTTLNISNFNTAKVTKTKSTDMFKNATKITNWQYDGANYANFTLTETDTGYSGTFPW